MAQKNDRALKVRILVDGVEYPGLVKVNGIDSEKGMIDVPGYDRIVKIQNGIRTIPQLELEYKDSVGFDSNDFFESWHSNNETHDVFWVATDAAGVEFDRISLPQSECSKYGRPEYDAASPQYAKFMVTLCPNDFKRIKQ